MNLKSKPILSKLVKTYVWLTRHRLVSGLMIGYFSSLFLLSTGYYFFFLLMQQLYKVVYQEKLVGPYTDLIHHGLKLFKWKTHT